MTVLPDLDDIRHVIREEVRAALREALGDRGGEPDRLRTSAEALDFLGLKGRSSISEMVKSGRLTGIRRGRSWMFRQADLDAFAVANATQGPTRKSRP